MYASELRPGDELRTTYDETLVVTGCDDEEITWEVDGDDTETHTEGQVQTSLDDGVIELVERGEGQTGGNGDGQDGHAPEVLADVDPSEVPDSDLYIRFGNIPEGERSYDSRNDRQEEGVSVYACERDAVDADADVDAEEAYYLSGTMLQTVFYLMFRDTYLVTGERVGTGADGEPLLRDVEAVAEVKTPKGVGGWVPREDA